MRCFIRIGMVRGYLGGICYDLVVEINGRYIIFELIHLYFIC